MILDRGKPLVSIGAWCLMMNHFHILIRQETDGGITKRKKQLIIHTYITDNKSVTEMNKCEVGSLNVIV